MSPPAGYEAALTSAALFDLSAHGTIEAAGDDAATFLHNLSTNDVKRLAPWHGCEAFFCNLTAKVIAQAWVWREPPRGPKGKEEHLWLDTPPGLNARLFAHLRKYIIGEDVELTDRTADRARLHLAGPEAAGMLGASGGPLTFTHADAGLSIRRRDLLGVPGFDVVGPADAVAALRSRLAAAVGSAEAFDVLRVEAGLPLYGPDISEETFAPETGRILPAISYTKGCYLGQEPIVMARDRGVVQRGLVGLLTGLELLPHGSALWRDGKEVGRSASAAVSPRGGQCVALAYLKRGNFAPGTALEADIGGRRIPVTAAALPLVQARA